MRPVFLFAPGAGAPSSHPWTQRWKQRLTRIGEVETFDYDYMREGRRRRSFPDCSKKRSWERDAGRCRSKNSEGDCRICKRPRCAETTVRDFSTSLEMTNLSQLNGSQLPGWGTGFVPLRER